MGKQSDSEEAFFTHLQQIAPHLPKPERNKTFCAERKWTVDFLWRSERFFVEIDGGNRMARLNARGVPFAVGRHTQDADYWKLNQAALLGFRYLRFTPKMLNDNPALCIEQVEAMITIPFVPFTAEMARGRNKSEIRGEQ